MIPIHPIVLHPTEPSKERNVKSSFEVSEILKASPFYFAQGKCPGAARQGLKPTFFMGLDRHD